MSEPADMLTIRRVANGWVVAPGPHGLSEFTHVYSTPAELADHVNRWATVQVVEVLSGKPPGKPSAKPNFNGG